MIEYTVKVYSDRTEWFLNGKLHRTDGPAVEYANGERFWYLNGQLHRTDGPACEWTDGTRFWYLNGKRHRTDGPALEWADGTREWFLNGKQVTEAEVMKPSKELTVAQIEQLLGYSVKVVK
jgi:hypothetical protein